jgi:hypothetical protein
MKSYDVQSVVFGVAAERAFQLIADPQQLPRWTNAFAAVQGSRATMRTPQGEVDVELRVESQESFGTVDWYMTFPDGSRAKAFSRIVPLGGERCLYSFVLTPPPVPLEQLEGALDEQSRVLAHELAKLKVLLETRAD